MVSLNPQQMAAVQAPNGPALVLAGAGTGKTRVIVERIAWLIEECGIDPRHVLALTFTNKAAAEMRERVMRRVEAERLAAWVGTFHSFGLYVLRREIGRLERKTEFVVFDDADQLALMKKLVKDLPANMPAVSPREALRWISLHKQQVKEPDEASAAADPAGEALARLWRLYHDGLRRAAAVDFDDLLSLTVGLFERFSDLRERYQRRYRHVLVDEYQDTNHAQYRIARALAGDCGNVFAVGDEDQSIYTWRGADLSNILDFARDFPDARVYRLEQNYRCTQPILDAANRVVANNVSRLGKRLWTAHTGGERVRFYEAPDADDEARFIVDDIARCGVAANEVAVLFRTNAQARLLEQACLLKGVHYVVVGGTRFYARKEIKDLLAYLRLLVNPDDDVSLRRIINVPARGIGAVTLDRFEEYAAARQSPLLPVLRECEHDLSISGRARDSAVGLVHFIDELAQRVTMAPVAEIVERLIDQSGYRAYVQESDEKNFRDRLEIVDEFVVSCREYDQRQGGRLLDFLQDLALLSDVDEWDTKAPAVTLMTCHSAKGLEFSHVYLAGLEEGLLPLISEFDEGMEVEEERRLCYVAMTRARARLTLTAATSRMVYGKTRYDRQLSRFLDEVGLGNLELLHRAAPQSRARAMPLAPAADPARLKTGTRVRHAKFGKGSVMYTSGSGERLKARIRFESGRVMLLMVKDAPLEILEGKGL